MTMCDYCIDMGECQQPKWHTNMVIKGDVYCDHIKYIPMPRITMNSCTSPFVTKNKEANILSNLITLCHPCHMNEEAKIDV